MKDFNCLEDYQYAKPAHYLRHLRVSEIDASRFDRDLPSYIRHALEYAFMGTMSQASTVYRLLDMGEHSTFYEEGFISCNLYYEQTCDDKHNSVDVILYKDKPFCVLIHESEDCEVTHILNEEVLEEVSKLYIDLLTSAVQNNLNDLLLR